MTIPQKPKERNFVAKHARSMSGAGAHEEKKGNNAKRSRQKKDWKKEQGMLETINDTLRDVDPFDKAIAEVEKQFDIDLSEACGEDHSENGEFSPEQKKTDMAKLIQQYQAGEADTDSDSIAMDLEQLGYEPDDIGPMVQHIAASIKKN